MAVDLSDFIDVPDRATETGVPDRAGIPDRQLELVD
jgi:hypothetical protein